MAPLLMSALLLAEAGVASAIPCPATASIEGPAHVTQVVTSALRSHGVTVGVPGACAGQRVVKAKLTPVGGASGYSLHIEDGFGRTSDRVVAEPAVAVSLIESWAVDEDADLLIGAALPAAAPGVGIVAAATPAQGASRFHLWGGLNSAIASEGSVWAGGALDACARWGPVCLGGQLDALRDTGTRGPTSDGSATRTTADLFFLGAMPTTLGRLMVMPSLGAGFGWLRDQIPDEGEGGSVVVNTFSLRAQADLLTAIALSKRVAIALDIGAILAPNARPQSGMDQGATVNVPAEPGAYFRAGLACVISP